VRTRRLPDSWQNPASRTFTSDVLTCNACDVACFGGVFLQRWGPMWSPAQGILNRVLILAIS
jgi:hypothetical protein